MVAVFSPEATPTMISAACVDKTLSLIRWNQIHFLLSLLERKYSCGTWSLFSLRATLRSARGGEFLASFWIAEGGSLTFVLTGIIISKTIQDESTGLMLHCQTSRFYVIIFKMNIHFTLLSCFRVSDRKSLEQILTPHIHPTESDPVTRQKWAWLKFFPSICQSIVFRHRVDASLTPRRVANYHSIIVALRRTRASPADAHGIFDLDVAFFIQKSRSSVSMAALTVSGHLCDRAERL